MVHLPGPQGDVQVPTAPTNLNASGAVGKATLNWSASSDNVGVDHYNIYRSATAGFTPSAGTLVGSTTSLSYIDLGVPAGTWYYKVTAADLAGNISAGSNQASAVVLADTVAPTVALTSPTEGANVYGTITVSANASDNVGVAGVQFYLDGNPLGAQDTTAPYSISWATVNAANGADTITAVARDGVGNTASSTVNLTVTNNPVSGLVGAWGFDEGSGTSVADSSGHDLSGIVSGASWVAGKYNGALSFNGGSTWVTVADNALLHLTNGMTLEAWVNPAASAADWSDVLMKERSGGLSYALYGFDGAGSPPGAWLNKSGSDYSAEGASALPANTWSYLAGTYDGSKLRLYVNGALVSTTSVSGTMTSSTSVLRIGGDSIWGEYFNGLIDEVRIYNRALSASEIATDMNTPITWTVADATTSAQTSVQGSALVMVPAIAPFSSTAIPVRDDLKDSTSVLA